MGSESQIAACQRSGIGVIVPSEMQTTGPWGGKVVLITGASSGIGASCAKLIGRLGARLALTALPGDGFAGGESDSTITVAGDIASAQTRSEIVERTMARFGRIDVLINNAGVGQYGYPTEVDTEISKRMFDINVFAPLALAQLAIPHMRAQKSGTIVNIGSVGGKVSLPWAVMYCATKWALHCIDDSLHRELMGSGIRVMKVCPGIVDTRFRDHVLAGAAPGRVEDIRRLVSPDQVAAGLIRGVERRKRTVFVPKIGFIFTSLDFFAPRVMDWYIRGKM
ncbi:MAG TPA: SDR family NAD(P)-dependent oxidoreductase [Terracidiphilus sp.]|nr:SDR family NAD(P)-dependent oxidoreductase [Terracidiphilus sp.]